MTEKSFKFALKTHNMPSKSGLHYDITSARTDRSIASITKDTIAKPSVRLSSSPIPLKQRKKPTSASQNHHQSTSVGPVGQQGSSHSGNQSHYHGGSSSSHLGRSTTQNTITAHTEVGLQSQKEEVVGESLTAREIKFAKQVKTYKSENRRLMQLLRDSQRILNEKLTESKREEEKIVALFNKLWPTLQTHIKHISAHKLLEAIENVMESDKKGSKGEDGAGVHTKGSVVTSNSANSTTLTTSQFQSTLMEALEQQKLEHDREKRAILKENRNMKAQRDALIVYIADLQQNEKVQTLGSIQSALGLIQETVKKEKENKRPSVSRKSIPLMNQPAEDTIPAFLKATLGLKGRGGADGPGGPDLSQTQRHSGRQSTTAFLEALSHTQSGEDEKLPRKSRTLGNMNPLGSSSSTLNSGGGGSSSAKQIQQTPQQQAAHHHLHHHNNYHLHHHHVHHGASPAYRAEAEMSPIQQRMMHYYNPVSKSGASFGRSPKP